MTDGAERLGWVDRLRRSEIELSRGPFDEAGSPLVPGPGWMSLIDDLHEQLVALDRAYEIEQIKEKFGILRFYARFHHPDPGVARECSALVAAAELRSTEICEHCGASGRMRDQRTWQLTLCDPCDVVEDERRARQRREIEEGQR